MSLSTKRKFSPACSPMIVASVLLGLLLFVPAFASAQNADADKASSATETDEPNQGDAVDDEKSSVTRSQAVAATVSQAHGPNGWLKREWRWDASVDVGYGKSWESSDPWGLMVGGRLGATFVHQPHYLTAGATFYWSQQFDPTAGLQVEYLSDATAMWVQTGGFSEFDGDLGAMAALGWQIFGVEAQVRSRPADRPAHWAVFGKVRVPVSWFFYIP